MCQTGHPLFIICILGGGDKWFASLSKEQVSNLGLDPWKKHGKNSVSPLGLSSQPRDAIKVIREAICEEEPQDIQATWYRDIQASWYKQWVPRHDFGWGQVG